MNILPFPSEQDDIVNSLNYEGIALSCSFTTFLTVTDCVGSVTD